MTWTLTLACPDDRVDILSAELWDRGATGIVEEPAYGGETLLRAFFDQRDDTLSRELGGEWDEVEEYDWVAATRESLQPIEAGDRLFLAPDWRDDPTPPGRIRITTHYGRAYGTGAGEATRLALTGIDRLLRPGDRFLDIGTGTGILCAAALTLHAASALACEIDPEALACARENLAQDGFHVPLFLGSADAVRDATADFIGANLNTGTIAALAHHFVRILKPSGRLVVSGFLHSDVPAIRTALTELRELARYDENGWTALVLER
ncbi:MAG: 50S ribosomal protein L11 methyltransferase [Bryobacteraceae bacterium]|nr:50S ribosomal protein L11 methyltransferase [Bryobacteraceae bacterium]